MVCGHVLTQPYKLVAFEQSVMDDFDKYVALFRETFKPAQ
jgi:hypothetical protein